MKFCRKLNLAFTVKSAVRSVDTSEVIIKSQDAAASSVKRRIDIKNIRPIEDVKAFGKQFEIITLSKSEAF